MRQDVERRPLSLSPAPCVAASGRYAHVRGDACTGGGRPFPTTELLQQLDREDTGRAGAEPVGSLSLRGAGLPPLLAKRRIHAGWESGPCPAVG